MTKPVQIINNYWLKETLLNGNPILDKFYKEDLIRMINILKDENQKYKEVTNKLKQFCNNDDNFLILDAYSQDDVYEIQEKLLDMLNEVEDK